MKLRSSRFTRVSGATALSVVLNAAGMLLLATPVAALAPGGRTIAGPGKTTDSAIIYTQSPSGNICLTLEYVSGSPTNCKVFDNGSVNVLTAVTASPGTDQSACTADKAYVIACSCTGTPPCVANWRVDAKR